MLVLVSLFARLVSYMHFICCTNGVILNKAASDTIRQAKIVPESQMVGNTNHAKITLDQRTSHVF